MPHGYQWILVAAVALTIGFGVWHTQRELSASQDWPATPGVIKFARVVPGSDGSLDRSGQWFEIEIEYTYSVEGVPYLGKRMQVVPQHYADEAAAQAVLQGRVAGASLPVFYAPGNPAVSILIRN